MKRPGSADDKIDGSHGKDSVSNLAMNFLGVLFHDRSLDGSTYPFLCECGSIWHAKNEIFGLKSRLHLFSNEAAASLLNK